MIDVSTAAGCFVPFNWNRLSGLLKVLPRCFPFFAPLLGIEVGIEEPTSRFDTADLHLVVTAHIVRGHKQRLRVDILD